MRTTYVAVIGIQNEDKSVDEEFCRWRIEAESLNEAYAKVDNALDVIYGLPVMIVDSEPRRLYCRKVFDPMSLGSILSEALDLHFRS